MDNEKFKVQGSLAIVLRLSRALGLAPIHLVPDRGGYIATVSRSTAVYGCIFTFCIQCCGVTAMYKNIFYFQKPFSSFPIAELFILSATIIITGLGSYGGISRMKEMARRSKLFNKINYDLNGKFNVQRHEKLFSIFFTITTIFFIATPAISKCLKFDKNKILIEVFDAIFNIEYYKIYLLYMENALINFDVYYLMQTLNVKLRDLIGKANSDNVLTARRSSMTCIRDVMKSYVSVCELVKQLNAARGPIIFILFSANVLFLMTTFFNLMDVLFLTWDNTVVFVCIQLLWCAYHLSTAIMFIEPWEQTRKEVDDMGTHLTQLNFYMTSVGQPLPLELDLMFKQFILNQPTIPVLEMFTVQRSLLITINSFITTYFVIVVQGMKKRWEE